MKGQSIVKFNSHERRTAARHLRGLEICRNRLLLELCYDYTVKAEEARKKYGPTKFLPRSIRETHKEMCERLNMGVY